MGKKPKRKYASKNWGGARPDAGRPPNAIKKLGLSESAVAQVLFRAIDALTRDRDEKRAAKSAANRWKLTTTAPGVPNDAPAGHSDELETECRQLLAGLTDSQLERLLANPEIKAAMDRYCCDDHDQVEQRIRELERELSPAAAPSVPATPTERHQLPAEPDPTKPVPYSAESPPAPFLACMQSAPEPIPNPNLPPKPPAPEMVQGQCGHSFVPKSKRDVVCGACRELWDRQSREDQNRLCGLLPGEPAWRRRR
jgi:hypothetical protein